MRNLLSTATLACAILGSGLVQAATVQPGAGKVSINFGGGFVVVRSASVAQPGTQVMVGTNGSAVVIYNKACIVKVGPGAVYSILDAPPCDAAGGFTDADAFAIGGVAVGVTGLVTIASHHNSPASP